MKRLFLMMSVLFMALTAMSQRPLVTLSHDGELSFFSSLSAFEEALDSAKNGDTIYLSEGMFTSKETTITIDKRVSIVGCGYKSHILPNILINMHDNPNSYMDAPLFDGLRIPKLEFKNIGVGGISSRDNLEQVEIRKCWIEYLANGGYAGKDVIIDRCVIETADFEGADKSDNNSVIVNSKIYLLGDKGTNSKADIGNGYITIINCNVKEANLCPKTVINSIIQAGTYTSGNVSNRITSVHSSHSIYSSLLGRKTLMYDNTYYSTKSSYGISYDNCYYPEDENTDILDDNLECTIDLQEKGYLGNDGTVVGVYGGEFPFSETPSVPTVDSANSSVEYDPATNKLNVTIKVAPN